MQPCCRTSALQQRTIRQLVSRIDSESSGMIQNPGLKASQWRAVAAKMLGPHSGVKSNTALAMHGLDTIAHGAQTAMSDVQVPVDAVRRGWGGL